MTEPIDILLEMAWRRYDESCQERRDLGVATGVILAVDGVLLGICFQIPDLSGWVLFAIAAILISTIFAVLTFAGQRYNVTDTIAIWRELSTEAKTKDDFQARIISAICAIEKANTEKTQRLWCPLGLSIAELTSALIFLALSLL